jgi:hypothetical protein
MDNKVNKKIGAYDKLQVKHSVHIMSSIIKQQSSFQSSFSIKIYINSPIYTLDLPQKSYKEWHEIKLKHKIYRRFTNITRSLLCCYQNITIQIHNLYNSL